MTIQECYQKMGADFACMERRIPNVELIKKFISKFPDDGSFSELCNAVREGNREKAFHAAHSLKGVSGNLSLDRLYRSVSKLTDLLRVEADVMPEGTDLLLGEVRQDYDLVVSSISAFLSSEQQI